MFKMLFYSIHLYFFSSYLIMPTYKLIYYNFGARAETARMLFKLAGQEFEDYRLPELKLEPEFKKSKIFVIDEIIFKQTNSK